MQSRPGDAEERRITRKDSVPLKANRKVVGALVALVLLVGLVVGTSFQAFRQIEEAAEAREHVNLVRQRADELLGALIDAETGTRGYALTGDRAFLRPYLAVRDLVNTRFEQLRQLVGVSAARTHLDAMRPLIESRMADLARVIKLRDERDLGGAMFAAGMASGMRAMDSLRAEMQQFMAVEKGTLTGHEARFQSNMHNLFAVIVAATILSLLVAMFFVYLLLREGRNQLAGLVHLETKHLLDAQWETNSQLKEANATLRISEELLVVTLNSIGDAVLTTDVNGLVTRMNPLAEKLTGWPLKEAVGHPVDEIIKILNQETRKPASVPIMNTLAHGTTQGLANHTILVARGGSECAIADSCAPIRDREALIIGAVLVFRDVSGEYAVQQAAREREALLHAILNTVDDGVITLHATGALIEMVNPAAESMFGYSAAELLGKPFSLLVPELNTDQKDGSLLYYAASDETRAEGLIREVVGQCKDGRHFKLEMAVTEMQLAGGRFFTGVLRDVTTRRRIEMERNEAMAAAEKASHAKTDFLSSMSHELRTPLNAILGFAQLIESGNPLPTPTQKRSIDQILKAGWYLLELISEVLDLARIESGKVVLSREPVVLTEVMLECRAMVEPQALQRGIRMTFPHFDVSYYVSADRTRLKQVLINLLFNAVKYNRPEGAVSVECTLAHPDSIRINVRDTGMGLTPEQMAHLFQPFNRLGKESGAEEGTGIGLVVTKRLIELMGGSIGVESSVGTGSVFWVDLKLTKAPRLAPLLLEHVEMARPILPEGTPMRTLLYVEDNPANLELVEQIIERRPDLRLLSAADGNLGIEFARTYQPDVILMDINLPGISGTEVMKILRADPATAHIPIIAISANAMPRDIDRAIAAGFFDYLTKPIKVKQFVEVLDEALTPAKAAPERARSARHA